MDMAGLLNEFWKLVRKTLDICFIVWYNVCDDKDTRQETEEPGNGNHNTLFSLSRLYPKLTTIFHGISRIVAYINE